MAEADTEGIRRHCEGHDTTLVFSNSRRQAENAADRLNAVWSAREQGVNDGVAVGSGEIGTGALRMVRSWRITAVCRIRCDATSRRS